jgi:glycosyltransferase involved in cell wall biosynthesis
MPPGLSVVVPTRDRPQPLRAAVASLLAQQPAGWVELIVVDDGSHPETRSYLDGLSASGRLLALRSGGRGAAAARNLGIAAAGAPLVACTDDDCEAPPDWAFSLAARLSATGAAAVGGRVEVGAATPLPGRISQAIVNGLAAVVNPDPLAAAFLTSNNVAYRADMLREIGGFDEGFGGAGGEDRDLHARLLARGHKLVFAPDIVVRHRPALGWIGLFEQQAAYGRGARRYYARDAARPRLGPAQRLRAFAAGWREMRPGEGPAYAFGFLLAQAALVRGYWAPPRHR